MLQIEICFGLIVILYAILVATLIYFFKSERKESKQVTRLKYKIKRLEIELGAKCIETENFRCYLSEIYSKTSREKCGTPWDKEYIAALAKRALEKI